MKLPEPLAHIFMEHICDEYFDRNKPEDFLLFSKNHMKHFFTSDVSKPVETWFEHNAQTPVLPLDSFLEKLKLKPEDIAQIDKAASIYIYEEFNSYRMRPKEEKVVSFENIAKVASQYYKKSDTIDFEQLLYAHCDHAPQESSYHSLRKKIEFNKKLEINLEQKTITKRIKI